MKYRLRQIVTLLSLLLLLIALVGPEWPAFADDRYRLKTVVGLREFDFLRWELKAFQQKAQALLARDHTYMDAADRQQMVLDYLALLAEARSLEREIEAHYVDPAVTDPDAAVQELQAALTQTRGVLAEMQPLAEAIVQDQVAWALQQERLTLLGQAWPPVLMHMSPLPSLLVISPRDRIESMYQVPLAHGLGTPAHEEMETAVYQDLDLSALVVPLGGLGTYPAMIVETTSIQWLVEVTAHEWTHHWLTLQPLGIRYWQDAQMRIINETVASLVDEELRDVVLAQFYPDYLPPPAPTQPVPAPEPNDTPPPFDFRAEMAQTRVRVDELLAAGDVDGAEAYMEERRAIFVENGYNVRKLNQAYFAFYGAYAAQPGATGGDPIGPMLRAIREESPSLRAFLQTVALIKSYEDLVAIHEELVGEEPVGMGE